jgi:hypothetical protein
MLYLSGTLLNVIRRPARTLRDGRQIDAYAQVQVSVQEQLEDGQIRHDLLTMSVDDPGAFDPFVGKPLRVPVRAYSKGAGVMFAVNGSPA